MKKMLNFKQYRIFEQASSPLVDIEGSINFINTTLSQIEQLETLNADMDDDEFEEFLDAVRHQLASMPEALAKSTLYNLKLTRNIDYIKLYKIILQRTKKLLESGITDLQKDEELDEMNKELLKKASQILNISEDEFASVMNKFLVGAKKYNDMRDSSRKTSEEDPWGEEVSDGMSDEERIRKAYEED